MFELEYCFECLNGKYFLNVKEDNYEISTDIAELENKEGLLTEAENNAFQKQLNKAGIEKWDKEYPASGNRIEDAVKWSVRYTAEGKEYFSTGEESYEPYTYNELIRALMIIDEKAQYFLIGE